MSSSYGVDLEELKQPTNPTHLMTSTSLKKIQDLCNARAKTLSESDEQYAHAIAMAYEHIALLCETEIPNERQMIIDICNECAKDIMNGNVALGKPVGEQLYKKKYA
jgi:hypothetical protein